MADSDTTQQVTSQKPAMADSDTTQQVTSQKPAMADSDTTQQVTSQKPATKQKNPNRVTAGKATAAKTKMAREAQKKALAEAQSTIANYELKYENPPPTETESTKNVLTTTQLLGVISIVVSLAGIYYQREKIKVLLTKKRPPITPLPVPPNSPVLPRRGIQSMD